MVDFRNPYGMVNILDGGAPRIITGTAAADISGGELVKILSDGPNVSSGADSYAATDIAFEAIGGVGSNFGGVALETKTSGTESYLAVARRGAFISPVWSGTAFAEIEAGHKVMPYSGGQVASVGSMTILDITGGKDGHDPVTIGRAFTQGGPDEFVAWEIIG